MSNNVNIYYEEKEVHDAFKNYYNDVKQYANIHIFTKNEILLSLYAEDQNVFVHSPGNLWNKFKSWLTGEVAFANQFSKLNIPQDKSERYRSIINRGGTIIIWSQDEPDTVNDFVEKAETTSEELSVPIVHDFNPSQEIISETELYNDNEENYEQENPDVELENSSKPSTAILNDNTTSQTDVDDSISSKNEEDNTSEANGMEVVNANDDLIIHSKVQDSSQGNDLSDQSIQEENLFIADDVSKQPTSVDLNFEYYEDGPRKHNIYSENLKKLTHEHAEKGQNDENNDEPSANLFGFNISQETLQQAIDQVNNHFGDALNHLNSNGDADSQMTQPNLPSPNELFDLVQQIPPDDLNNIFNMLTSPQIPTDSTESVLDFDLQTIIKKLELGDVKKEFSIELEVEEEMNKTSTEDQDIEPNEAPEVEHHVHDNYIQDSTAVNTSEQQNESP